MPIQDAEYVHMPIQDADDVICAYAYTGCWRCTYAYTGCWICAYAYTGYWRCNACTRHWSLTLIAFNLGNILKLCLQTSWDDILNDNYIKQHFERLLTICYILWVSDTSSIRITRTREQPTNLSSTCFCHCLHSLVYRYTCEAKPSGA